MKCEEVFVFEKLVVVEILYKGKIDEVIFVVKDVDIVEFQFDLWKENIVEYNIEFFCEC